jgi:Na+-transporting NADH:ubiquinone oxidoreductase subunit NqrB
VTAVSSHKRDRRATLVQLPFALVLLIVAVAAVLIFDYHWRQGAGLIGGALLVAGLFRAILPSEQAGLLAIRGKPVDVLSYGGLAVLILFVTFTITGGPLS